MRNSQGSIANLTGLLTKDGTKEALLGRQLSFSLWSYLTYQNIAGSNLCTNADNTVFVQILQIFLGNIWNITGNFLRSQLGITSLAVIFLNMNGGINISLNEVFTKKNSILVVVTFPWHICNDNVVAQCQLTMVSSRTISYRLLRLYHITLKYDRELVDAGALVGAHKLLELVLIKIAVLSADNNLVCTYGINYTGMLSQNHNTGVARCLVLHTSTNQWSLGTEKRNCLTLHVGTHQCAVSIIVFQEWNHGSCNGNHLLR